MVAALREREGGAHACLGRGFGREYHPHISAGVCARDVRESVTAANLAART